MVFSYSLFGLLTFDILLLLRVFDLAFFLLALDLGLLSLSLNFATLTLILAMMQVLLGLEPDEEHTVPQIAPVVKEATPITFRFLLATQVFLSGILDQGYVSLRVMTGTADDKDDVVDSVAHVWLNLVSLEALINRLKSVPQDGLHIVSVDPVHV